MDGRPKNVRDLLPAPVRAFTNSGQAVPPGPWQILAAGMDPAGPEMRYER